MKARGLHPEVLTAAQRRVLKASTVPVRSWEAYLAGGAAAGLHLGHRRSDDFDWFTPATVNPGQLLQQLESTRLHVQVTRNEEGTFLGFVDDVKFSVFRYRYPLVAPLVSMGGAQIASLPDIAAMKLVAVVQRAEKRDYVDIHAILLAREMSLAEMFRALVKKSPQLDPKVAQRALGHFADAEKTKMPQMLNATTWEKVKADLARELSSYVTRRK
ncbi:MAG: nucleotidyl transferase AbiEii/AbiGii toxin family protein [Deltaproteobacteria bacterium]|nr:nucleotidyl transferase AbiEii/AbiGii toxin family protein [Deltaproteobacteria bacterium]